MTSATLMTLVALMGLFCLDTTSAQCFGLHCAGNNLGVSSSLLGYLQLGNVGVAQVGGGRYFYRRYKERASKLSGDVAPIEAMNEEMDEDRKLAVLDLIDQAAPRPGMATRPADAEQIEAVANFAEDAAKDGFSIVSEIIHPIDFITETLLRH